MILVRCVVRTIEGFEPHTCSPGHPSGDCGYITTHEWVFWVFEVANITLFVTVLAFVHPGKYLPRDSRIYLDPLDSTIERVGPGFLSESRSWWKIARDPFNLQGIFAGKGMVLYKFWEEEQPVYEGGELPQVEKGLEVPLEEAGLTSTRDGYARMGDGE